MSFFSKLFKKQKGGSIIGNLFRGAVKAVPIVGGIVGGVADSAFEKSQAKLAEKEASNAIQSQPPTVDNIVSNAGFPTPSSTFQTGQYDNPTQLGGVTITPQRQSTAIDVDWKRGRVKYNDNPNGGDNNQMLLFGMLGLGAIMLLNKR